MRLPKTCKFRPSGRRTKWSLFNIALPHKDDRKMNAIHQFILEIALAILVLFKESTGYDIQILPIQNIFFRLSSKQSVSECSDNIKGKVFFSTIVRRNFDVLQISGISSYLIFSPDCTHGEMYTTLGIFVCLFWFCCCWCEGFVFSCMKLYYQAEASIEKSTH